MNIFYLKELIWNKIVYKTDEVFKKQKTKTKQFFKNDKKMTMKMLALGRMCQIIYIKTEISKFPRRHITWMYLTIWV